MKFKCEKCGRCNNLHLIWPMMTLAVLVGLYFSISAIVNAHNQEELRKQYLLSKMSPAWETMYYVLQKVETNSRGSVMIEFIGRAPQFFEGQDLSAEQMDLFLGLFPTNSVPDVVGRIDPKRITKKD